MDIGESLVAAYLRHVRGCDVILTNVHLSGIQGELDVVGLLRGDPQKVWLCEVTTHTRGMNNPARRPAAQRVTEKIDRAVAFAADVFPSAEAHFEVWSPLVRPGLVRRLRDVADSFKARDVELTIVANEEYTSRLQTLVDEARATTATTGDDAFRLLQILTRVKGPLRLDTASDAPPPLGTP
jgi:hypothetical protein